MLLQTLLTLRSIQAPATLLFLLTACWIAYLVNHSTTQSPAPAIHLFTTTLRFLTALLTLPYTLWEIYTAAMVIRNRDFSGKFALHLKSRGFKIGRVLLEFALGGLWFVSFVLSLGVGSWTMTGDSTMLSSYDPSSNGTMAGIYPSGNGTSSTQGNMAIVPDGGKSPMMLGSAMWVMLIGLFSVTSLLVVIQTARNWNPNKKVGDGVMGGGKGEVV